jgi:hypothetical protein
MKGFITKTTKRQKTHMEVGIQKTEFRRQNGSRRKSEDRRQKTE